MKTLIVYASSKGYVTECVDLLKKEITEECETLNLKKEKLKKSLTEFDTVVIGGSIHIGKIQKPVKKFCSDNLEQLRGRKIGLFLCCMEEEKFDEYIQENFPEEIRNKASVISCFGGRIDMNQQNFLVKKMLKNVKGSSESVFREKPQAVTDFARELMKH
ncbi:MAG: flavodoxin domain-containing protein [Spirochaetia bacterium]|nr:flavodoxin domain-containing protein [Spirochaetia bacterium]